MQISKTMKLGLFLFCLCVVATAAPKKFTGKAKVIQTQMDQLFSLSQKVNDKKQKAKSRKGIENAVDWQAIARSCIEAKFLKKTPKKKFTTFQNHLKKIISLTAYSRMDSFWKDTKYEISDVTLKGSQATVVTKFIVKKKDEEGDYEETYDLKYFLKAKGKKWLLYDLSFEDIRYSTNIREQIGVFLKGNNFDKLLAKLKKRLSKLKG